MNLTFIYLGRYFPVTFTCQKVSIKKGLFFKQIRYVVFMDGDKYSLYYLSVRAKLSEEAISDIVRHNNGEIFDKDKVLMFNTEEECIAAIRDIQELMFITTFVEEMLE